MYQTIKVGRSKLASGPVALAASSAKSLDTLAKQAKLSLKLAGHAAIEHFDFKAGSSVTLWQDEATPVVVLGLGEANDNGLPLDQVRQAGGVLVSACDGLKLDKVGIYIDDARVDAAGGHQALAEGMGLANFRYQQFVGEAGDKTKPLPSLAVHVQGQSKAVDAGLKLAEAVNGARIREWRIQHLAQEKY